MFLADLAGGIGQGVVYAGSSVVSAGIIGGAIYYNKKRRSSAQKLDRIYSAFVGEEASPVNPTPEPGLVSKFGLLSSSVDSLMLEHQKRMAIDDKMVTEFETWKDSQIVLEAKVDTIATHVAEIGKDSKALVYDSKRNNGGTSRDALARIEENTRSSKDTVDAISGTPETVTLPDLADTLDRIENNTKPGE